MDPCGILIKLSLLFLTNILFIFFYVFSSFDSLNPLTLLQILNDVFAEINPQVGDELNVYIKLVCIHNLGYSGN